MNKNTLVNTVLRVRKEKGLSQEKLADLSGLSLRTIQRIEAGSSKPTGDTIQKLSEALEVDINKLITEIKIEDKTFLKLFNYSALSFLIFPLFGIFVPLFIWIAKRNKIKDVDGIGKQLLNFEITWNIAFFLVPFIYAVMILVFLENLFWADVLSFLRLYFPILYLLNIIGIVFNSVQISKGREVKYFSIRFL